VACDFLYRAAEVAMEKTSNIQRVLVADDDQSIRQLVVTIVRREGYEVDAAADGEEAIELLRKHEYSVLLLDLMMPRLDGFGVIDHLKAHPQSFKPVVLVITAYADQRFKEVDADVVAGVLRKPFEVAELGSLVQLCVNGINEELSEKLTMSSDRAIRDFVANRGDEEETQN
jgi:two-component system response regulator PilR (NtrC family)